MLKSVSDYWRLMRAGIKLAQHDVILPSEFASRMPLPARLAGQILRAVSGKPKGRQGERLARALEELGPAYIKLGQFLATRPDVFGVETTNDLARLKDKLPAFPVEKAEAQLKAEFGEAATTLFPKLEPAIAAASLAQVHKVMTPDGLKAVKVLRPGVDDAIFREMSAMKRAAATVETIDHASRRMRPIAFVETVSAAMEKELDLRLEAGGADEFAEIARDGEIFSVPKVDWERTGKTVLTTEWIDGIPLTDTARLAAHDFDRHDLAEKVTQGFLKAAIHHGVFHADMHEGNMILSLDNQLYLIDFGIVGRIGKTERRFLAEILNGFIERDYLRVAQVHFEAGYVPKDRSVGEFAQALRSVGEPIHGKAAREVSMGRLLMQLLDFTHVFGMEMRPELVLLQKTMVQVEGVARAIDPDHDIWTASKPIVKDWILKEFSPQGLTRTAGETLRDVAGRATRLPALLDSIEALVNSQSEASKRADTHPVYLIARRPLRSLLAVGLTVAGGVFAGLWLYSLIS